MSEWKIGQKVKVKTFKKNSYPAHWVKSMVEMAGELVIIQSYNNDGSYLEYKVKGCNWSWVKTDFEDVNIFIKLDDNLFKI